ncbi:hypothetical protein CJ030_MR0G015469 [Morella rubra]|uniref:Uncharacterized protein n=1 Tax=Morella rubra TaxID=262757 RepID=A0A6A1UHF7_9ROSI|nr:hypothetical protein CJ030_MR0G015469 [Morella rubra]
MNKRLRTSSQADVEGSSAPALSLDEHTIIMSRSVVVERHIQLADFYELRFEDQTLPEIVEQAGWLPFLQRTGYASKNLVREFYASILRVRDLEEPSMEVIVRNVQIIFSPDELFIFGSRLAALELKVVSMDVELKKQVSEVQLALKGVATSAELVALTERVVLLEEHMSDVRAVLHLSDD